MLNPKDNSFSFPLYMPEGLGRMRVVRLLSWPLAMAGAVSAELRVSVKGSSWYQTAERVKELQGVGAWQAAGFPDVPLQ